MITKRLFSPL